MTVLAIDTASREEAHVLVTDAAGIVAAARRVAGGRLDAELPAALAELIGADLLAVVVLTGPGSYTGVRAGMAAALGVAAARRLPLHGIGSLEAVAAAAGARRGEEFLAAASAGRGGVHVARFRHGGGGATGLGTVELRDSGDLGTSLRVFATGPIGGAEVVAVDPVAALAAAVPVALSRPPLAAAGLAATAAANRRAPRAAASER